MNEAYKRQLLKELQKYAEIPESEWEKLEAMLRLLRLDKNQFFIRVGDKPDKLAMIVSGIFRVFCVTESGEEKTLVFRMRPHALAPYTSFVENRNVWYSIQAVEGGELLYISFDDYRRLSSGHPCWEKVVKEYFVRLFIEKEERERSLLTEDATTRYLSFRQRFPDFENLIPQYYIASYLGISPISLSRIRKNLKKEAKLT